MGREIGRGGGGDLRQWAKNKYRQEIYEPVLQAPGQLAKLGPGRSSRRQS